MAKDILRVREGRAWKAALAGLAFAIGPAFAVGYAAYEPGQMGLTVGAGAISYIAQRSPGTGMALDARLDYRLSPIMAMEGSGSTAFSSSVDGGGTTVPVLVEGGLRVDAIQGRSVDLFGGVGLGYGAYLGTRRLQDGATLTLPLSLGATVEGRKFNVSPRFTYRPVFGDQLGQPRLDADADSWMATLDVRVPLL